MNLFYSIISNKIFPSNKILINFFILLIFEIAFLSCSPTRRIFDADNESDSNLYSSIRVLLLESSEEISIKIGSKIILSDESNKLAEVKTGNTIMLSVNSNNLLAKISDQDFVSTNFYLDSEDANETININSKKYRGRIKILLKNSKIEIVNQMGIEDYVKGVMTKEMPIGNGIENYQALKAFSICVRTYAFNKIKEQKDFFDIYTDTRDQVYGGVDGETDYTNKIVDETAGQILTYEYGPATIFYHSTCGGFTEDVENVFGKESIPYLTSVEDGSDHYCKISPRYEWKENYSEEVFVDRLFKSDLIESNNYRVDNIEIISRFGSGRVNKLKISLLDKNGNEKTITLIGNNMRSVIKSGDNKSILKSNYFEVELNQNKEIVIDGKGSGHGVGMCQWGAIGQSKLGVDYLNILSHYFPGTKIKNSYD